MLQKRAVMRLDGGCNFNEISEPWDAKVSAGGIERIMSQSIEDDEIDLRELFAALISGWFTIGVSTAIALVVSILYALFMTVEKYESI